ncbi:hypothetical protein [Propionicicella superfundia]|uniref:hypothetical protein n=1 Tax=Propionicicella superfundia TaxID=348582 RepID=UPI0004254265|nr:hypothetical protein [Propionicicella superfundia]
MKARYTRGQWWLLTWAVVATGFALTALFVARVISTGYDHTDYRPVKAGEAYVTEHGSIRLLGLYRSRSLTRYEDDPGDGAVYVVATLEASIVDDDALVCLLRLVQDDGRSWAASSSTYGDERCPSAPTAAPVTFAAVFVVPEAALGRLAGVAVSTTSTGPLLRPPPA